MVQQALQEGRVMGIVRDQPYPQGHSHLGLPLHATHCVSTAVELCDAGFNGSLAHAHTPKLEDVGMCGIMEGYYISVTQVNCDLGL